MKKITPFLWFDTQAEEAMNFYVSLFKNSKVRDISRGPDGRAFIVSFELDGQEFMGRTITVNIAKPREDKPRNFGDRNRGGGGRNRY